LWCCSLRAGDGCVRCGERPVRKRLFVCLFMLKTEHLPRQARDKHRGKVENRHISQDRPGARGRSRDDRCAWDEHGLAPYAASSRVYRGGREPIPTTRGRGEKNSKHLKPKRLLWLRLSGGETRSFAKTGSGLTDRRKSDPQDVSFCLCCRQTDPGSVARIQAALQTMVAPYKAAV
jgi:hypothetical protein